jgi:hypothetical protein
VCPRASLYGCGKFFHPPGFDSRSVQPVASGYTDCAWFRLRLSSEGFIGILNKKE